MTNTTVKALVATLLLGVAAGCLDLKPAAPPVIRWLTLPLPIEDPAPRGDLAVTVRSVVASAPIEDRLILRPGPHELRYDEFTRWAVPPEESLLAAVEHELFIRRGMGRTAAAGEPTRILELRLEAFEDASAPRRVARVTVRGLVYDGGTGTLLDDRRIRGEAPIEGADPTDTAKAMGVALRKLASGVAETLDGTK